LWQEKHIKEVSPKVEPSKEWLMEVKRSSKAIHILSPSTTMPCSLRGTVVEALHNPSVGTSIMSKFLAKNLLGNMPLVPTNKLFKSSSELIFECCGIAKAMPIIINETEVHLDFHIYAILDFDLLIGYPFEILFQEKPSHGSLNKEFGKTASATHLDITMAEHHPNNDPLEEVKFVTPFVSPSPLLKIKQCPSGHPNIILNSGLHSTNVFLENKSFYAIDILLSATSFHEDHNHLSPLVCKLFKRMVVDVFIYHKYCKSRSCTMAHGQAYGHMNGPNG
jgi:hypothetical protein